VYSKLGALETMGIVGQSLESFAKVFSFTPGFNRVVGFGKNSLTVSTVSTAKKERETVETVKSVLVEPLPPG
jgi:hypothetical protein